MKIALCQINTTVGALTANAEKIARAAAQARRKRADLAVFPELTLCGYPPRDLVERAAFSAAVRELADKLVATLPLPCVFGTLGTPRGPGTGISNDVVLAVTGRELARRSKTLLPAYDVFDEMRLFTPARSNAPVNWDGRRYGLTICEDAWARYEGPEIAAGKPLRYAASRDPFAKLARAGVDVLINISASPFHALKQQTRADLLGDQARRAGAPIVYVNLVGGNDQLVFDGGSMVIDAHGRRVAELPRFKEAIEVFDFERRVRTRDTVVIDDRYALAELYDALVLGIHDYFAKTGFKRAVVGLSGGIDSALTATLAVAALGKKNVLGLLMPSRYSSRGSIRDAAALARNLGIETRTVPIEAPFDAFLGLLGPALKKLPPPPGDATEENIQARLRAIIVMAYSNRLNALALTTGNKSEVATGYCTLYGDMAGGLAVLADVYKTRIWELARWINRRREVIPWASVNKVPSAELKPNQTDQDTLPPYDVLDRVLERYLERQLPVTRIVAETGLDVALVRGIVRRVDLNEYKRQQAAPAIKVTPKAFGMGRRIPIARGYDGR